jgi:phosphopantetheinyl transferase
VIVEADRKHVDAEAQSLALRREGAAVTGYFAFALEEEIPPETSLGPAETAFYANLRFPARQRSFLSGRVAGKRAVLPFRPESSWSNLDIGRGVFEQPILSGGIAEISIAHTDEVAVAVASSLGHPIGIDIERLSGREVDALATSFTSDETKRLQKLSIGSAALYCGWTIKEALAKILRCGLMTPFHILEIGSVAQTSENIFASDFLHFPQYKARTWILRGFAMSIALPARTEMTFKPGAPFIRALQICSRKSH